MTEPCQVAGGPVPKTIDPEIFFKDDQEAVFDEVKYEPRDVAVIEIDHFENRYTVKELQLDESGLSKWLDEARTLPSGATGGLRLILGPVWNPPVHPADVPLKFPVTATDEARALRRKPVPFSIDMCKRVNRALPLPAMTIPLMLEQCTRFRSCSLRTERSSLLGYTMTLGTRGRNRLDTIVSMSYDPGKALTCAWSHGLSRYQQAFVRKKLMAFVVLASHPFLLPVVLFSCAQEYSDKSVWGISEELLSAEVAAGQTPVILAAGYQVRKIEPASLTETIVSNAQETGVLENTVKTALLSIECLSKEMTRIRSLGADSMKEKMETDTDILAERLAFIAKTYHIMLNDLGMLSKKAQAQMTAVYNYIAQKDAHQSQGLAADSQQIAAASKRDSTAMKAVALLTMVFLPATFMATFFAMPLVGIDKAPDGPVDVHHLWLYWAIAIPLTVVVLVTYFTYVWWAERKRRNEDDTTRRRFSGLDDEQVPKLEDDALGQESKEHLRFRLPC